MVLSLAFSSEEFHLLKLQPHLLCNPRCISNLFLFHITTLPYLGSNGKKNILISTDYIPNNRHYNLYNDLMRSNPTYAMWNLPYKDLNCEHDNN